MSDHCTNATDFHWGKTTFETMTCELPAGHTSDHRRDCCVWVNESDKQTNEQ